MHVVSLDTSPRSAQIGQTVGPRKRLRSDRGGEYFLKIFDEFCEEHGIIHERTPPYSPESNGIAKRKNRMVLTWLTPC